MKYLSITIVGILGVIAAGALFAATQYPYQAEKVVATESVIRCGAGYYNEGYIGLALFCIIAACVMALVALDYLKNAALDGTS